MFFKKEKKVIELIIKYVDEVEECAATAEKGIQGYLDGDITGAKTLARQTNNLESKADLIRHTIRDKLYSGAYLPALREDIYRLVETIDKVANAGEASCDFFLNQRPEIPESLYSQFTDVVKASLGIVKALREAVLCFFRGECTTETVREYAKDVGMKESEVDKLEWDLTKAVFTSSLDHSHKIHLKLCLDTIVEVSDRAENAADQLELAALKAVI